MKDKRSMPRMNVIAYYKMTELTTDQDMGRVTDMSTEGMRLHGDEAIDINTPCRFEMALPDNDSMNDSVVFDANVVWCQESAVAGMYDTGIRVVNISTEDSNHLQEIVENLPTERRFVEMHRSGPGDY